jgi:hypothetical protein
MGKGMAMGAIRARAAAAKAAAEAAKAAPVISSEVEKSKK